MKVKFHISFEVCNTRFITSFKTEDFKQWILSLKPKDLKDKGILKRTLYKIKHKIKHGKTLNPKTKIVKILLQLYKDTKLNN